MTNLIIQNISKMYGSKTVLNNINLEVQPGIFGLLGPNGAGKSTLMRILTTVESYDDGTIEFGVLNWKQKQKVKNLIGYLPQNFSLYKQLTVIECLLHIAGLKGIRKDRAAKVLKVLEQVNLLEVKDSKISKLSGGMVRRVGIAQAILGDPKIIIVDEPTAGLDPEERIRFRNILHKIGQKNTVVISSHIVEDIETLCTKAAILHKGSVLRNEEINALRESVNKLIWSTEVDQKELNLIQDELKVIRQQSIGNRFKIRFLSKEPPVDSVVEIPTLEDAYFYYMQRDEEN
ncbi:ABC transporter ATP-binding protein [Paenibacillus sp. SZ31]|uniref:ABC transporter ATP-binding protein n=1 Tax=Paenibacillus sp. SZ31 TaxID=2725555 RepID=UPI00146B370A|nr:ABC transporter ATP-binding protein [Paenibacillus sp. SZ31]NMI07147.1 ABC transporter ATP-binding protein [Paenibacillus sp. SZ31]